MCVHKTWYSVVVAVLGLLFVSTSLGMFVSPEAMIPSLLAGFNVDLDQLKAFEFAFLGNNVRNLVIGAFIIYYAFRDTKIVLLLLSMRFCIELLDLVGGFIWNPAIAEVLPVFFFMLVLELFLIIKGNKFLKSPA